MINYGDTQEQFVDKILLKLPCNWAMRARVKHQALAKNGLKRANEYLLDLQDAIQGAIDIDIDSNDDDLIYLSLKCVDKVRVLMSEHTTRGAVSLAAARLFNDLQELCFKFSVRYPIEHDRKQILARLTDSAWWLRGLRVSHAKKAEGAAIDAGIVNKRADVYCSTDTLQRRTSQRKRNAETLEGVKMINTETGEIMSLADIAKGGTGNHENRRAELVTRVRGFEELANKYGHAAEFITVTCPSRMHAVLSNGKPNPKYDGTKPDEAQKYLVDNWARVRAQLARDEVKFYGLRIAEPHHDATPHWHMILFYRKSETLKRTLRGVFMKHFLADSGDEAGALTNRVKFVAINAARGTASGYVLKYVLKNIGGLQDGERSDETDNTATNETSKSLYPRVEAWAACWRIRQFQQIGGHYVTVWRELRRVDACKLEGKRPNFVKAWQSCQKLGDNKADFAGFIEAMGGLEIKPRESLFKVDYDYTMGQGKYGVTILTKVLGVGERFGDDVVATNRQEWVNL